MEEAREFAVVSGEMIGLDVAKSVGKALDSTFDQPSKAIGLLLSDKIQYSRWKSSIKTMSKAKKFAEKEYEKFRPIQDKEFKSDFDKMIEGVKKGELPKEKKIEIQEPLSDFNQKLKQGLNYDPKEERSSGLSLSSIKKRKDHKNKK